MSVLHHKNVKVGDVPQTSCGEDIISAWRSIDMDMEQHTLAAIGTSYSVPFFCLIGKVFESDE